MAFEFANLSCDHLEITCNQCCSDGALILGNSGIKENEMQAMNGERLDVKQSHTKHGQRPDKQSAADRVVKAQ